MTLAEQLCRELLSRNSKDATALMLMGVIRARQNKNREALELLRLANKISPRQPWILNNWGLVLKNLDETALAIRRFQEAVAVAPNFTEAYTNLGLVLTTAGDNDAARAAYEKALQLNPHEVQALAGLASLLFSDNDDIAAATFAERALAQDGDNITAQRVLADIALRQGDANKAIDILQSILGQKKTTPLARARLLKHLVRAHDALGAYVDALKAADEANDILHNHFRVTYDKASGPRAPATLTQLFDFFGQENIGNWRYPKKLEGDAPIFLVGFPRSGTTLLDQIFSGHEQIAVLEEKENFFPIAKSLLEQGPGLSQISELDHKRINSLRKDYWRRLHASCDQDIERPVIIDKMPLDVTFLGLIYRIFPDAKIIFALRDPRDVLLSCYKQNFQINVAMFQLLKLETAAAYYDQVMQLTQLYRQRLSMPIVEVRYEQLVHAPREALAPVLEMLELEWSDSLLNHQRTAAQRRVRTPSSSQVIKPLYTTSIGQWRHVEKQMACVLPILQKWVNYFGYESTA